jgi:hypothetical protein
MGEKIKGLSMSPFLAIHAKGGEILSLKQKYRTTNFKNLIYLQKFGFQLVSCNSNFFNWDVYFNWYI